MKLLISVIPMNSVVWPTHLKDICHQIKSKRPWPSPPLSGCDGAPELEQESSFPNSQPGLLDATASLSRPLCQQKAESSIRYQRGGRGASSKKNILPHRGPLSLPNGARVSPQHWTVGRSFLGEPRSKLHRTPSMLTWHGYPAHSLSAQPAPPTGPAALPSDALGPLKKETTILECLSQATLKVCTHPQ
jgi:hypothetical protein